jgi:ribonucleoside-diphosphate reductase alpha chain
MSDAKFYESYARFDEEKQRYETWDEAVERVMNMHRHRYSAVMTPELEELIDYAEDAYKDQLILGAQRALQFGGEQLLAHQIKIYNCFSVDTKFVTSDGMRSFEDFRDGERTEVLTHKGNWKPAVVRKYGRRVLNRITFKKHATERIVKATSDHRWILKDGTVTESLRVGDLIYKEPKTFAGFDWETATTAERKYWCYGMVYGDGSVGSAGYSHIRLCKRDSRFASRFEELGFKTSSPESIEGDVYAYTGTYKKTAPDPKVDSPEMIRAFVAGYLQADGIKNNNAGGKAYQGIQVTGKDQIEFVRECFPIAGVHIISENDLTGQETNFGVRPYTIRFVTCDHSGSRHNAGWKVSAIEEIEGEHDVWCLEVEDDKSFILEHGIVTGNCVSSHCDRPEFFGEFMYMLLCGAGAGFSVQHHHIAKLPPVASRTNETVTHVVEDSIEGWADALDILMSSYFIDDAKHPNYSGKKVHFDLTHIRPKGAKISGGFLAPGPEPLRKALDKIETMLEGYVTGYFCRQLNSITCYDICMYAADAVISGGVRRSATICLFSPDDQDMVNAKTGSWFVDNPQRARSNNSAVILRDGASRLEFSAIMEKIKQFGEPGFVFVDSLEFTVNPCVEIGKLPKTEDGRSGWQGCNLTEMNGAMCINEEIFLRGCRASAILGTLQAGYTDFKFLGAASKEIFEREALIGCSITGWTNSPDLLFNPKVLQKGASLVKEVNKQVAALIGINPAARTTCAKPSGNASVLLMTESGIHGGHSPRFIRNVQMDKTAEVAKLLSETNPNMIEDSVWSSNGTDYCISFPVECPEGTLYKQDLLGIKQLELVKIAQENWVEYGTDEELCVDPRLRHNISNTIAVDDWNEVEDFVFANRHVFAGISFMAASGDKAYSQAPFTEVKEPEDVLTEYGVAAMFASGLITDGLTAFNDNLWLACDTAMGFGEKLNEECHKDLLKRDWVRRFKKFAKNYLAGDEQIASFCLKDIYNIHRWEKIRLNYKPIDWTKQLGAKEFTDIDTLGAVACSGGTCELSF